MKTRRRIGRVPAVALSTALALAALGGSNPALGAAELNEAVAMAALSSMTGAGPKRPGVIGPSSQVNGGAGPTVSTPVDPGVAAQPTAGVFVHCTSGDDSNPGTTEAPLRSVSRAVSRQLAAGSTVWLARGCSWDGRVVVSSSGTAAAPITLTAYGTGDAPLLTGAAVPAGLGVLHLAGAYVQVTGLRVSGTAGVGIDLAGVHDRVTDTEVDNVGLGVVFSAPYGVAERVRVHDLHMVRNTPGGVDDYGAVGFVAQAADAEIAYCSCTNCRAPSRDFGHDGGFVEIWNYGDRLSVHDSTSHNTEGFLEVGGNASNSSADGVVLRNNVFTGTHGGLWLHGRGTFGMMSMDIAITGNLIENSSGVGAVLGGYLGNLTFGNNIVSTPGQITWGGPPAKHMCNVFFVRSAASVGFRVDATERVVTNAAAKPQLPASCG